MRNKEIDGEDFHLYALAESGICWSIGAAVCIADRLGFLKAHELGFKMGGY